MGKYLLLYCIIFYKGTTHSLIVCTSNIVSYFSSESLPLSDEIIALRTAQVSELYRKRYWMRNGITAQLRFDSLLLQYCIRRPILILGANPSHSLFSLPHLRYWRLLPTILRFHTQIYIYNMRNTSSLKWKKHQRYPNIHGANKGTSYTSSHTQLRTQRSASILHSWLSLVVSPTWDMADTSSDIHLIPGHGYSTRVTHFRYAKSLASVSVVYPYHSTVFYIHSQLYSSLPVYSV